MLNIGAHLTISNGIPEAMSSAAGIGATNFQFFPRNPRGGSRRVITDSEISAGRQARIEFGIKTLICHLPYTVNPASPDENTSSFARMIISEDVELAAAMGADFVVMHPGSHVGSGYEVGIAKVGEVVLKALGGYAGKTKVLFEMMAGGGTALGATVKQTADLIAAAGGHDWLGVCLDSCHLFAAGWDVATPEGLQTMLADCDAAFGLGRIGCMHLNDSKTPLGSHKDRHEKIGQGLIGLAGIKNIVNDPFISGLPLCLETPVDDLPGYAEEIRLVKSLYAK
jgi:deoxyribonuclease-4